MGEPGRTEQIISQLQSKILTAVLSSRIPSLLRQPGSDPDPDPTSRRRARWFNLALPDLENFTTSHSPFDPLLIDVLLSPSSASDLDGGHVVERWSATCSPPPPPASGDGSALHRRTYKKSIVLLRSLYSVLRLLPCFKIFKMFSSATHSYSYELGHRISTFAEPFSRSEEKNLRTYSFTAVESHLGYITLSVTYRYDLTAFDIEPLSSLTPPMIIPDYVGSPAADPARPFRPVPPSRPHSWDSKCIPIRKPAQVAGSSGGSRRASFGFEEFRLSPPFSVSPTPSPPAMYVGSGSLQARMRAETAPVSIPVGMGVAGKGYRMANHSDPARSFLPPPSPRSTRMEHSNHGSPLSESRSFRKSEGLKLADFYSNLHLYSAQKGLKDGRDDSGRFSGGFSSSGSPRFGFSRSSSRLSIQDDLDDCDFSFPFAVDDVDTSDSQTRNLDGREVPESSQAASSHKSQDAEVGVLVRMLRTAPPLRQDHSYSSQSSRSEVNGEVGNSSFYLSRKTSDALEELRSYREIKDILLSQSRTQLLDSVKRTTK